MPKTQTPLPNKAAIDKMVCRYREEMAQAGKTDEPSERQRLLGVAKGIELTLRVFGVHFDSLVANSELHEIEPGFFIAYGQDITVDEAKVLIGECRKQSENASNPDSFELRDLLKRRIGWVSRGHAGRHEDKLVIVFNTGGLATSAWVPEA